MVRIRKPSVFLDPIFLYELFYFPHRALSPMEAVCFTSVHLLIRAEILCTERCGFDAFIVVGIIRGMKKKSPNFRSSEEGSSLCLL